MKKNLSLAGILLLVSCATQEISEEVQTAPLQTAHPMVQKQLALLQDCGSIETRLAASTTPEKGHHKAPLLKIYDLDEDKQLSEAERATLADDLTARCEKQSSDLFARFDADKSGDISSEEASLFQEEMKQQKQEMHGGKKMHKKGPPTEGAAKKDVEGKGEHHAKKGARHEMVLARFDTDQDGALSVTEKDTMRVELRAWVRLEKENPFGEKFEPPVSMMLAQALGEKMERPHGPPPVAIEACAQKVAGDACSFTGRDGEARVGSCAQKEQVTACRPEKAPKAVTE
jgi:hypothetical protein